jgi:hypothetical protein
VDPTRSKSARDNRGALACTLAAAGNRRVFLALRSPPRLRDLRSPVIAGPRVCVTGRADGDLDEAVWCHERKSVSLDAFVDGTAKPAPDEWQRFDLGPIESLAGSPNRLCALSLGRARCVDFPGGEARTVEGIHDAVQLVLGDDFGCARDRQGGVRCFGEGTDGALGDGDPTSRADARPVPLPGPASEIAASYRRACAVVNGEPLCWGLLRPEGQIPAVVARTPQRVAAIDEVDKLALGLDFTCATRSSDGTVRCWGFDAEGALGDGSHLPTPSCAREGYSGTSPERERPGGPTVVRTGDAGPHPEWRTPLALLGAALVLAPLGSALARARAAARSLRPSSLAAKIALHGHAILVALLVPIALTRLFPGVLAAWNDRFESLRLHGPTLARVALSTLAPVLVLAVAALRFHRLRRTPAAELPATARLGAAWILGAAAPLLGGSALVTRRVNEDAREELVYLVRDAALDLGPLFHVRGQIEIAWLVLAAAYALFTVAWARVGRAA